MLNLHQTRLDFPSVYNNLSNKMDVSDLDIQYIDEDEALEDLFVVERELNDEY